MKKTLLTISMIGLANFAYSQCTEGDAYPQTAITVSSCNGTTPTILTDDSWSGEYTSVNVVKNRIYQFSTSEPDYFITIASSNGTPLVYGKGPVTYSPTENGVVRFYSHTDENCGYTIFDSHEKIVICSPEPTTAPNCTTITLPNNANPNDPVIINWATAANATSYKLYIGTSTGNYDIVNGTTVTSTSYTMVNPIANTDYYIKVVPLNTIGEASGCQEQSFTLGNADYCTSIPGNFGYNDGITNVKLKGETKDIENPTSSDAGNEYTNYSDTQSADLIKGKKYKLEVYVNTDGDYEQYQVAWIDWNQNKVFDANERYDLGTAENVSDGLSSLCPLEITVPTNAVLGDTRMRVRTYYYSGNIDNPCKNDDDGEVEDYKITVLDMLSVNDVTKGNISVYPNPFIDTVKLTDITNIKTISVTDISGKLIKTLAPQKELNLSNLKAGVYIINLSMEDGTSKSIKAIKK